MFNENYFSIPTIENSYWAGLIATDGCIVKQKNRKQRLILSLAEEEPVKRLKQILGKETKISFIEPRPFMNPTTKKIYLNKGLYTYRVSSDKIAEDLKSNFSITINKTNTLKPPNIDNINLIKAFLCGVIDGDGCISVCSDSRVNTGYKFLELQICGNSPEFLFWCRDKLALIGGISNTLQKTKIIRVRYTHNKAKVILNELIKTPIWKFPRKWNKVIELNATNN